MDLYTKTEMFFRMQLAKRGFKAPLEAGRYYVMCRYLDDDDESGFLGPMTTLSSKTMQKHVEWLMHEIDNVDFIVTEIAVFYGETMVRGVGLDSYQWVEYERGVGTVAPQIVKKLGDAYAEAFA